jgi:hypothetical protein
MRENTNNNMESFYEENAQFSVNNNLKRPLTLDLNNAKNPKRQRFNQSVTVAPVLSSPDLHMLKLASPELEKMILNGENLPTPTPLVFPTKVGHTTNNKKKNKTFLFYFFFVNLQKWLFDENKNHLIYVNLSTAKKKLIKNVNKNTIKQNVHTAGSRHSTEGQIRTCGIF